MAEYNKEAATDYAAAFAASQKEKETVSSFNSQVGGEHYLNLPIQPATYCHLNNVGKLEGDVVYYVTRWRQKGGMQDLQKALHTLELLIELERKRASSSRPKAL